MYKHHHARNFEGAIATCYQEVFQAQFEVPIFQAVHFILVKAWPPSTT